MSSDGAAVDGVGLARLHVEVPIQTPAAGVAEALRNAPERWLGSPAADQPSSGARRYLTDLRLHVSDHPALTTFHKAAVVDLGPLEPDGDGWAANVDWHAATMAPLFPVFSGRLRIAPDRLALTGVYAPPGGAIGRIADRLLLNVAARGTARYLLETLGATAAGVR